MKEKIIEGAGNLFVRYGIRSVSMDDIANNLAISKKTLYQYFKDKDDVVSQATMAIIEKDRGVFLEMKESSANAIEELSKVSGCLRRMFDEMNPSLLFDLNKYHPDAWEYYLKYKNEFIFQMITDNLTRGVKEGNFRDDININILARLRVEQVQICFDQKVFPKDQFDFKEVQMQVFDLFLFGIVTSEGKTLYEKYQIKNSVL
jgi:AcrR family transcriptional regulator